jgi:hypothetical protein
VVPFSRSILSFFVSGMARYAVAGPERVIQGEAGALMDIHIMHTSVMLCEGG